MIAKVLYFIELNSKSLLNKNNLDLDRAWVFGFSISNASHFELSLGIMH